MYSWKELVCVVVAAGGLLGLGAATAAKGSATWKRQVCADNLRQVSQLGAMYQNDHDGAFQPVIVRTKPSWTFWYSFLARYGKNPGVFYCPANPKAEKTLNVDEGESDLLPVVLDPAAVSYGMNFSLSSSGDPKATPQPGNVKELADPATMIYFGDSNTLQLRPTKWCWNEDYAPRHEEFSNFVYVDGHTEALNKSNLGVLHEFDGWKKDTRPWKNWK